MTQSIQTPTIQTPTIQTQIYNKFKELCLITKHANENKGTNQYGVDKKNDTYVIEVICHNGNELRYSLVCKTLLCEMIVIDYTDEEDFFYQLTTRTHEKTERIP